MLPLSVFSVVMWKASRYSGACGELTMMVTVNFDGSILATDIIESSGNKMLDRRAQAIVRSIGNFGKFTDAMRRQTDQIVLPSRFRFTHDETLETQLSAK